VVLQPPPPVNKQKPPPPPPEPPKPKVDQVKFPPPVVKPDNEVKEQPPTVKELEVADPGQKNIKGDPNADIKIDEPVGNSDVKQVTEEDPNKIFTAVEQEPTPAGGMPAFYKYLQNNMRYPAVAKENNVQGKVFMQFVVEKDGSLTDVKVIRGIGSGCDQEAIRVLQNAPKWRPGIQNGRPVRVQYNVPISFTLQQEDQ
jgi:protein TonB